MNEHSTPSHSVFSESTSPEFWNYVFEHLKGRALDNKSLDPIEAILSASYVFFGDKQKSSFDNKTRTPKQRYKDRADTCPFCGGTNWAVMEIPFLGFAVGCVYCQARGPLGCSKAEAISLFKSGKFDNNEKETKLSSIE